MEWEIFIKQKSFIKTKSKLGLGPIMTKYYDIFMVEHYEQICIIVNLLCIEYRFKNEKFYSVNKQF